LRRTVTPPIKTISEIRGFGHVGFRTDLRRGSSMARSGKKNQDWGHFENGPALRASVSGARSRTRLNKPENAKAGGSGVDGA